MEDFGGIAKVAPVLSFFMLFTALASAGLPGLNGFVGEFLILVGAFKSTVLDSPLLVACATSGVILAAVYLLWMIYKTFFGEVTLEANLNMPDVNLREFALMAPLIILMIVMGFAPNSFLQKSEPTARYLLEVVDAKRASAEMSLRSNSLARADEESVPLLTE